MDAGIIPCIRSAQALHTQVYERFLILFTPSHYISFSYLELTIKYFTGILIFTRLRLNKSGLNHFLILFSGYRKEGSLCLS